MKVFDFDPVTGKRGNLLGEFRRPDFLANPKMAKCALPADKKADWSVATVALDANNNPLQFDRPVCFCIGQLTAGTDTAWHWYALLPAH